MGQMRAVCVHNDTVRIAESCGAGFTALHCQRMYDTRHVMFRPARMTADALEGRLRLGVPRVLSVVVNRRRVVHARDSQAPGEALRVGGRLEEVRVRVERRHPGQATARDDAAAGGGSRESVRLAWLAFQFCNRRVAFQHTRALTRRSTRHRIPLFASKIRHSGTRSVMA